MGMGKGAGVPDTTGAAAGATGGAEARAAAPAARSRTPLLERLPWCVLSGTALKWIAIVTMLVDHTGAILLWDQYLAVRGHFGASAADWYQAYLVTREIGRVAFPLFCFALVEGFEHTHSRPKYALRLLLFALISEAPYDFALHGGVGGIDYTSQLNVMFTLLLAFCALWLAEWLGGLVCQGLAAAGARRSGAGAHAAAVSEAEGQASRWLSPAAVRAVSSVIAVGTVAGAAWLAAGPLDVSYHAYGILLVGALYLGRDFWPAQFLLGWAATYWYCLANGSMLQMWALVGLGLIALYNGKRGRGMKYFFYLFYPLHLLALGIINIWVP